MSDPIIYEVNYADGTKSWYLNGDLHRKNGPAIEWANGDKYWYHKDDLHRKYGPAILKTNGDKHWYRYGERHCEHGPAIEWANGDKSWFLNDKELSHSEWKQAIAKLNEPSCDGKVVEIEGKKYKLMEVE